MTPAETAAPASARRIRVRGRVQGVGYRPFVLRLALTLGVQGWVRNVGGAVEIQAEGPSAGLDRFARALLAEAPPLARPETPEMRAVAPQGCRGFVILPSAATDRDAIVISPDHFVCADCLAEMRDPAARRHRYPFTNCTQCGPRYTLIDRLPYDRPNTAMADFPLCNDCRAEYGNPADRRYHAQPLACPRCGPTLTWQVSGAPPVRGNEAALAACVALLRAGGIVAAKGVGGYHLLCDARADAAVRRLRARKRRPDKPLAVMLPGDGLDGDDRLAGIAVPAPGDLGLLRSPLRPIVLLPKSREFALSAAIAPGLDEIGLMLPYSPLHHLLLADFGGPLVATSANLSGEPVLTDAASVASRLGGVADAFLHHDRPIRRPADDAVFRRLAGRQRPLRLGRGLAPVELRLRRPVPCPMLALGADLKNTIALAQDDRVIVSPHLGDLGAPRSLQVFGQVIEDLCRLFAVRPELVVADAHPDYLSTRWGSASWPERVTVHHHLAHAAAVSGEFGLDEPLLVFAWDGLGYGEDGTLWGGEALLGQPGAWQRVASLRPFRLIGGDRASREPWRCALALCLEAELDWPAAPAAASLARVAWRRGLNAPLSSSAGRLFDAAAALIGLCRTQSHEGHAAARLEALACGLPAAAVELPLLRQDGLWRIDWSPLLPRLMSDDTPPAMRAGQFHASLAAAIRAVALRVRDEHGIRRVGLTGGVFQNRRLLARAHRLLVRAGFAVSIPERLPVNDAAISFGQIVEAQARVARQAASVAALPPGHDSMDRHHDRKHRDA